MDRRPDRRPDRIGGSAEFFGRIVASVIVAAVVLPVAEVRGQDTFAQFLRTVAPQSETSGDNAGDPDATLPSGAISRRGLIDGSLPAPPEPDLDIAIDPDIEIDGELDADLDTEFDEQTEELLPPRDFMEDLDVDDGDDDDGDQPDDAPEEIRRGERLRDPDAPEALTLSDVIASTIRAYPTIAATRANFRLADGQLLQAYGEYDHKLKAYSLAEPLGFYEMYRNGLSVARQTWWGTEWEAGYKIGRGFFKPWFKERQTDDAGEFRVSVQTPLLQGRAIDAERVAVFQASLARAATEPQVLAEILMVSRDAAMAYWDWVEAGAILEAQTSLAELAERRAEQLDLGVRAGRFAEIDAILNAQLVAERQRKQVESLRKLQVGAIKLSLYLRRPNGETLVPPKPWLPDAFPDIEVPRFDIDQLQSRAAQSRPELAVLRFQRDAQIWDRRLACNQLLPQLDFVSEVSQDMGEPATSTDDKGPLELLLGITSEVPYQRRKARGKIREIDAKIFQIDQKTRITRDKIGNEIGVAAAALELNIEVVELAERSYAAALESLRRFRFAFNNGKIDLLYLNLIETKATEALVKLIEAKAELFQSIAATQVAIGIDPMDAAMMLPEPALPVE